MIAQIAIHPNQILKYFCIEKQLLAIRKCLCGNFLKICNGLIFYIWRDDSTHKYLHKSAQLTPGAINALQWLWATLRL